MSDFVEARKPDKEAPLEQFWLDESVRQGYWVRAAEAQACIDERDERIKELEREVEGWKKQFDDQVHRKRETRRILEAQLSESIPRSRVEGLIREVELSAKVARLEASQRPGPKVDALEEAARNARWFSCQLRSLLDNEPEGDDE